MLILWYYNWTGSQEERDKFEKTATERWNKVDGVKVMGIYTPSTEWNRVLIWDVKSYDKWLNESGITPDLRKNIPISKVETFFG